MDMVTSLGAAFCRTDHSLLPGADGATPVLLHDEPPGVDRDLTQQRLQPALLAELTAAETPALRQRAVRAMLQSLGFEWLGYGRFSQAGGRPVPRSFCTTYANAVWAEHYFAESFHVVDPRLQRVPESGLPALWALDELEAEGGGATPFYLSLIHI